MWIDWDNCSVCWGLTADCENRCYVEDEWDWYIVCQGCCEENDLYNKSDDEWIINPDAYEFKEVKRKALVLIK